MSVVLKCRWTNCNATFTEVALLAQHVIRSHDVENQLVCGWNHCARPIQSNVDSTERGNVHVLSHVAFEYYCWNSAKALIARGVNRPQHPLECSAVSSTPYLNEEQNLAATIDTEEACTPPTERFGCISCYSVFRTELEYLLHIYPALERLNKLRPELTTAYRCNWLVCFCDFHSYGHLHTHMKTEHLFTGPSPFCFWLGCSNELTKISTPLRFLRHLWAHAFIESRIQFTLSRLYKAHPQWNLRCAGVSYQKPSSVLRSISKLLWNDDILSHGSHCRWSGCTYQNDSLQLFVDHVCDHVDDSESKDDSMICLWSVHDETNAAEIKSCGRRLANKASLRSHLYRHTGLPMFVCQTCSLGFREFATYKEHFSWSMSEDQLLSNVSEPPLLAQNRPTSRTSSKRDTLSIHPCLHCGKIFLTKHRYYSHKTGSRCARYQSSAHRREASTCTNAKTKRKSICRRVPGPNVYARHEDARIFCCQVTGCEFQTPVYEKYRKHFRKYHSSPNTFGIIYACHLCPKFHVRKPNLLSCHLRDMHRIKPPPGRVRYSYTCDPIDGLYRMTGASQIPQATTKQPLILPRRS